MAALRMGPEVISMQTALGPEVISMQKKGKGGMANAKMYIFLERNIVCINEYGHRLTFGIFYYVKYYDRIEIQCGAFFHTLIKYINCI